MSDLLRTAELIRDLQVAHPTPVRDLLAKLITEREYIHGSRTTFLSTSIAVETHTRRTAVAAGENGQELDKVDVSLYGEFTFDGVIDRSAKVRITYWFSPGSPQLSIYTQADRWNGHVFANMPEGARRQIATQVAKVLESFNEWTSLAWEDHTHRQFIVLNRFLGQAAENLEHASKQASLLGVTL
jgi:hypothetical protein